MPLCVCGVWCVYGVCVGGSCLCVCGVCSNGSTHCLLRGLTCAPFLMSCSTADFLLGLVPTTARCCRGQRSVTTQPDNVLETD